MGTDKDPAGFQYPVDDNLRLLLSKDHEKWLLVKVRDSKWFVGVNSILFIICMVWLAADPFGLLREKETQLCYKLTGNAEDIEKTRQELLAEGKKICPPAVAGKEAEADKYGGIYEYNFIAIFSYLILVVSVLTIARHLYLLRKYRRYLQEHREFLAGYNRT